MGKTEGFKLGEPSAAEIEEAMVHKVLEVAGGDEYKVRDGIIKALFGVNDKARRTYLWNLLQRKAIEKIRRDRKKAGGN